jgi:hypothetical protein
MHVSYANLERKRITVRAAWEEARSGISDYRFEISDSTASGQLAWATENRELKSEI